MNIDREIAERVMGWKEVGIAGSENPDIINKFTGINRERLIKLENGSYTFQIINFFPSTNIADAWQVVERMREFGYKAVFYINDIDHVNELKRQGADIENYEVEFDSFYSSNVGVGHAETAPMAICKAALKAINGGEV